MLTANDLFRHVHEHIPEGWTLNIRVDRDGVNVFNYGPDGDEWPDRSGCKTVEDEVLGALTSARAYNDLEPAPGPPWPSDQVALLKNAIEDLLAALGPLAMESEGEENVRVLEAAERAARAALAQE